jgi:hypothetical protein
VADRTLALPTAPNRCNKNIISVCSFVLFIAKEGQKVSLEKCRKNTGERCTNFENTQTLYTRDVEKKCSKKHASAVFIFRATNADVRSKHALS